MTKAHDGDEGLLLDRVANKNPEPFWDGWTRLRKEYYGRISA